MLNDEEKGDAGAAGVAHLSRLSPAALRSSPETTEGALDRLIHDPAGRRLSKQFKDKVSSFLKALSRRSARLTSDTTLFHLQLQLCSSSLVKDFLFPVTDHFVTANRSDSELLLPVINKAYTLC